MSNETEWMHQGEGRKWENNYGRKNTEFFQMEKKEKKSNIINLVEM